MDVLLSSAVEEICLSGANGLSLSSLLSKLNLSTSFKQPLYQNLLNVPSLHFRIDDRFEEDDAERIKIVGSEEMRDNFLGLYDAPNIKALERKALQRLSLARTNGITQNDLAKEFKMAGKNLFYILKVLESQRLIVRQPAVVRTKEPGFEGESKNSSCVTTNMVYLSCYAKHLATQQKIEINKEERGVEDLVSLTGSAVEEDVFYGGCVKEDVFVKDYLPAMIAVCDKLKEADGKVLVVSDIKRDLGYVGSSSGHKAWRRVCERLGIDKKKNYARFCNMISRFGMHVQAENYKKTPAYRVWTSKNHNSELSSIFSNKLGVIDSENIILNVDNGNIGHSGIAANKFPAYNQSTFEDDFASSEKWNGSEIDGEISHGSPRDGATKHLLLCPSNLLKPSQEQEDTGTRADLYLVSTEMETNVASSETPLSTPPKSLDSYQAKPRQALTADAARREQKILEWLQDKKFILRCEMLRWLINLEKDKGTTIDKKTIDRIVNKLQQQGHCKCMHINVPSVTNCGRSRITQVVLHQSVPRLSPELLSELHDRLRSFEMQSRSQSSYRCKDTDSVPVLDGVQRTQNHQSSDAFAVRAEVMRANGFVLSQKEPMLHEVGVDFAKSTMNVPKRAPNGRWDLVEGEAIDGHGGGRAHRLIHRGG